MHEGQRDQTSMTPRDSASESGGAERTLPTIEAMGGSEPDIAGGQRTEDYVRQMRGGAERTPAAFVAEMVAIDKARREGQVEDYCESKRCRYWDAADDYCALMWRCDEVAMAWECWLEFHGASDDPQATAAEPGGLSDE